MTRIRAFIDNSGLLIVGTVIAIAFANAAPDTYADAAHALHFVVNDIGMVFFFALAAKEVVEAALPGGALSSPRAAALPVLAAVGGMVVPAAIYLGGAHLIGDASLARGWAIPSATDIAFSYLAARWIFSASSPAIPFLLLLAIADDAFGLVILALFYPASSLQPAWLLMLVPALAAAWWLRRKMITSFWAYLAVPGVLSWIALAKAGIHPALALVPIIPFMPSAARDLGLFHHGEGHQTDTLNRFEHAWKTPVQFILFFFAIANAGVQLSSAGSATWLVLAGLLIGKPLGVVTASLIGERFGLRRAADFDTRALIVVGLLAGVGFTVALFFSTAAFPVSGGNDVLNAAKMGALLSFAAAPLAFVAAKLLMRR